jgi:hypothetical protein
MRHPHADLIHAWAEGAEIEVKHNGEWTDIAQDIPPYAPTREYRIKPQPKPWYENIPPHGVLCWVSNKVDIGPDLMAIHKYDKDEKRFYSKRLLSWAYATPLTDDEIRQFLRGGE